MHQEPYTLAYVVGSGRNGSTLLDLMLAGHPGILSLGEISTVNRAYDPFSPPPDDHVVRQRADQYHRFWNGVKDAYEAATGRCFQDIDITHPRLRHAVRMRRAEAEPWVSTNLALFRALYAKSGRPVLLDNSKVPQRLLLLRRSGLVRIKAIHLVRDGRAVSCSYLRRYGSFYEGIRTWTQAEMGSLFLRSMFAAQDWIDIHYEDLATRTQVVLRDLCAFLDVAYDERIMRFREHEYLGVGGNPGVKSSRSSVIRRDDRWRTRINPIERVAFGLTAGWLNRINGYPALGCQRRRHRVSSLGGEGTPDLPTAVRSVHR